MRIDKANESILGFSDMKKALEQTQLVFEEEKKSFYDVMDDFYKENPDDWSGQTYQFENSDNAEQIPKIFTVTRVQPSKLIWDIQKLKKKFGQRFIKKSYSIVNPERFISYMKELGADPKILKELVISESSVDESKIEHAASLGEIDREDLNGLYEVKLSGRYFKVTDKVIK